MDVAAIELDIQDAAGMAIVAGYPFENVGGVWSVTVNDLVVGATLTFTAHAFDSAGEEIFRGMATATIAPDAVVTIRMQEVPAEPATLPTITDISYPTEVEAGATVHVIVHVEASEGDPLSYAFISGGGGFDPASGSVVLTSSVLTIYSSYSAPETPGAYSHTIEVTNEDGVSVRSAFGITVVNKRTDTSLVTSINPVVTSIGGMRSGTDVVWTAGVSDDGPLSEISYSWSFDGGLAFADPAVNPATMLGYSETVSGTITLRITDGDDGTTVISIPLAADQFPDNIVVEP